MSMPPARRRSGARAVLITVLALLALPVAAWWADAWTQRKPLVIDTSTTGVAVQAPVSDLPALVRLHAGNFPQFLNVRDGCADLRFVAGDDQTPLKYHVEKFDAAAQMALVWTRLPNVAPQSTDNRFLMYFGNAAAVNGADAGATYDADTALVLHFSGASPLADSTAYQTAVRGQPIPNPASLIGQGVILDGAAGLVVDDAAQLAFTAEKGFTIALWARFDELPAAAGYLLDRAGSGGRLSVTVNGGTLSARYGEAEVVAATPLAAARWQHVAVSVAPDGLHLFLDGVEVGAAPAAPFALDGPLGIGAAVDGAGALAVQLDEVQVATVTRSADYLALAAALQGERNDSVVTYGADESADSPAAGDAEGGHGGNFAIIFQNVFGNDDAIVEQLVIGVCGLMMMIAILVMFLKAVALSRASSASRRFLAAYEGLAADTDDAAAGFTALYDRVKAFKDSPLFRVYRRGIEEVRSRTSPGVGAAAA
ncbi:MAG: DUF2341 domain-containing protein, partial [Gammaproteobacteria bacterium]